ncbi:hypothetical protein DXV75_08105 [Alteromonas aestuariivivens]|uniref:Uncharacterized protein n=1 Tax=Alteromonas aestuariivivens TaxID=1938339 RepID=A0A3D8M821_9ALTE|nr:hypothetical protein [Alteromonas aestuariivivens]RDV26035.1 hypothetical protein DXV75_08105 [Alteromonas aestuariivivens]
MSTLDKDKVLADFKAAYQQANGKEPSIEAKGGWYSVDGGKNVRLAQLAEMIGAMSGKSKAAPAKKAVVKKPAKRKAKPKAKDTGFSVKDFWASKITDANSGAILPR